MAAVAVVLVGHVVQVLAVLDCSCACGDGGVQPSQCRVEQVDRVKLHAVFMCRTHCKIAVVGLLLVY